MLRLKVVEIKTDGLRKKYRCTGYRLYFYETRKGKRRISPRDGLPVSARSGFTHRLLGQFLNMVPFQGRALLL